MTKEIDNIDALYAAAFDSASVRIVLMEYVAPVVEGILRKHIETDIYGAYSPTAYDRRMSLTNSIKSQMISDNELLVTAASQPNFPANGWHSSGDGAFLHMLELGDLGWWRKGFPRPAISNAQREVDSSTAVEAAKRNGIKRVTRR